MIIHIEICDVCRCIVRGGDAPVVLCGAAGVYWDVGPCCREKKFQVVKHAGTYKTHLLPRLEALIVSELSLLKEPQ
jgi:hypothetical protein